MDVEQLFSVRDRVALVTGGGQGIGRMIAEGLVSAGAKTYIASRKADVIEAAAAELGAFGECLPVQADLSSEEGCIALAEELKSREERLDILVNNAGNNWAAPLEEYPDAAFERCIALNIKGVFHTTVKLLPLLREGAKVHVPASVVNIASVDGLHVPTLETYAYAATKAGLLHLTRVLARLLAPDRITVNAIAPGPFESKMMHETIERFGDQIKARTPLRRLGEPEDMAAAVIYLASRSGSYVTGSTLVVDGGATTGHE